MIYLHEQPLGSEVSVPVQKTQAELPDASSLRLYYESSSSALVLTVQGLAVLGPTLVKFTPNATGKYTLALASGEILAVVDVVSRTLQSYARNIEDEALGSWQWSRTNGTLQLLRQDGSVLANFAVTDTLTNSSRERTL